jgi:hypothetical protein
MAAAEADLQAMDTQGAASLGARLAAASMGNAPDAAPADVPPPAQATADPPEDDGNYYPSSTEGIKTRTCRPAKDKDWYGFAIP